MELPRYVAGACRADSALESGLNRVPELDSEGQLNGRKGRPYLEKTGSSADLRFDKLHAQHGLKEFASDSGIIVLTILPTSLH